LWLLAAAKQKSGAYASGPGVSATSALGGSSAAVIVHPPAITADAISGGDSLAVGYHTEAYSKQKTKVVIKLY